MQLTWLCLLGLLVQCTQLVRSTSSSASRFSTVPFVSSPLAASSSQRNDVFTSSFLVRFHRSIDNDQAHDVATRNGFDNLGPVCSIIFPTILFENQTKKKHKNQITHRTYTSLTLARAHTHTYTLLYAYAYEKIKHIIDKKKKNTVECSHKSIHKNRPHTLMNLSSGGLWRDSPNCLIVLKNIFMSFLYLFIHNQRRRLEPKRSSQTVDLLLKNFNGEKA